MVGEAVAAGVRMVGVGVNRADVHPVMASSNASASVLMIVMTASVSLLLGAGHRHDMRVERHHLPTFGLAFANRICIYIRTEVKGYLQ
jgi:hypothetical protein